MANTGFPRDNLTPSQQINNHVSRLASQSPDKYDNLEYNDAQEANGTKSSFALKQFLSIDLRLNTSPDKSPQKESGSTPEVNQFQQTLSVTDDNGQFNPDASR